MGIARSGRIDRVHRRSGDMDKSRRECSAAKKAAFCAAADRQKRMFSEALSQNRRDVADLLRSGEQGGFASIKREEPRAGERSTENGFGNAGDKRARIDGEKNLFAPGRDPVRDLGP